MSTTPDDIASRLRYEAECLEQRFTSDRNPRVRKNYVVVRDLYFCIDLNADEHQRMHTMRSRGDHIWTSMPSAAKTASKLSVNLASRSRIRKRNSLIRSPRSISRLRAA